ncbi:MAG: thiosulfate sulfurtransferase [Gammaproteobacteria bacterium]|nr:thiosulfate sulfurtransferase [Gammaproteobacteria bacterium]
MNPPRLNSNGVCRITVLDAKALSTSGRVQFVDIRDEASYQSCHIENAIHLDEHSLPHFLAGSDRAIPLIVYCQHGIASVDAAYYLAQQGYETVYSLEGGIENWQKW